MRRAVGAEFVDCGVGTNEEIPHIVGMTVVGIRVKGL
jgi:hypothetical protein